jgi:hypothetical protein
VPLTGLTARQVHIICAQIRRDISPHLGRPWGLPLAVRVLLVLILPHQPDHPGAGRAVPHQPVRGRPDHPPPGASAGPRTATRPDTSTHPWIIDGTLIPLHDQSITAISKNYRRSVNTKIVICAHRRRVVVAGQCWPGNRNDVVVARHTMVQLLEGRVVLGDGGYRGITSIATPQRDHTGRIIHDDRYPVHRKIRVRGQHVIARLNDWRILRQCRRRGEAINHSLQANAGLWNLKIHNQLRVTS